MNVSVVMPQLGLTMTEGAVSAWLKKPGDLVQKGESLLVVSTDKADVEVESQTDGVLTRIVVEPGKTVPVGTVIATIEKAGEEAVPAAASTPTAEVLLREASAPAAESEAPAPIATLAREKGPTASPRARRLASKLSIDLSRVQGSGPGGRIVEEDVRKSAISAQRESATPDLRWRQLIAEKMVRSIQTIPHFSVSAEVNAGRLLSLRESLRGSLEKAQGLKLTLTDLLIRILAFALVEIPEMNAVWEEGMSRGRSSVDLGLAIETAQGVVAPVIQNVDKMDLAGIANRRSQLIEKARQGRLSLADLERGVGTLSNLGMYGVDRIQALITPGQTFVLAVGRIRNRPWVEDTVVLVRPTVILSLSVDHRVADGAMAARFLGKITEVIENPPNSLWGSAKAG